MILQAPVLRLLRLVLEKQDFGFIAEEGFSDSDFQNQDKTAFDWAKNHSEHYNAFPSVETLSQELNLDLPQEAENYSYVIDSFRKYALTKKVAKLIEEAATSIERNRVEDALSILAKTTSLSVGKPGGRSFRQTAEDRYDKYEEGKYEKNTGLTSPWPTLNAAITSYNVGVHVWIAKANIGKTWASLIHADHFLSLGKSILLVSMEDEERLIENRIDAKHFRLSHKDLMKHQLKMGQELKWRQGLVESKSGEGDIILYTSQHIRTVADVVSVATFRKPDVIIIDAAYRLYEKGESTPDRIKSIAENLQSAANNLQLPIIITTQQSPDAAKKASTHERGYSTRGGREWMVAARNLFELSATEDQRLVKTAQIAICKGKDITDAITNEFLINWNLARMEFTELQGDDKELEEEIGYL